MLVRGIGVGAAMLSLDSGSQGTDRGPSRGTIEDTHSPYGGFTTGTSILPETLPAGRVVGALRGGACQLLAESPILGESDGFRAGSAVHLLLLGRSVGALLR